MLLKDPDRVLNFKAAEYDYYRKGSMYVYVNVIANTLLSLQWVKQYFQHNYVCGYIRK